MKQTLFTGISLCLLLLLACQEEPPASQAKVSPSVVIRDQVIQVELADTPASRQVGLGGRNGLAPNQGMLFVYPERSIRAFWMKDMRFDIDIIWIAGNRIVDISANVPHKPNTPKPVHYMPSEPVSSVLEVAAGTAQAYQWSIGNLVEFHGIPDGHLQAR